MGRLVQKLVAAMAEAQADSFAGADFMRLGGEVWLVVHALHLYARTPSAPPEVEDFIIPTNASVERAVALAKADRSGAPLASYRAGDRAQLGTIPVPAAALRAVQELHEGVEITWSIWRNHFVGRNPAGEVIVLWRLPPGATAVPVMVVKARGVFWATNKAFAVQLKARAAAALTKLAKVFRKDAGAEQMITEIAERAGGVEVAVVEEPLSCRMGPVEVPVDQYRVVFYQQGKLTWRYSGPREPLTGWRDGRFVAFILPLEMPAEDGGDG